MMLFVVCDFLQCVYHYDQLVCAQSELVVYLLVT